MTALDEKSFAEARAALAQQFSIEALSVARGSELLWHAKLAGHPSDYLKTLYTALMELDTGTTLNAAQRSIRMNAAGCAWRQIQNLNRLFEKKLIVTNHVMSFLYLEAFTRRQI